MKIRSYKFALFVFAIATGLSTLIIACTKKEENKNQLPSCKILSPIQDQNIYLGEEVAITIDAIDIDGHIREVFLFIDGYRVEYTDFPDSKIWNTSYLSPGIHEIRALSIDNADGSNQDVVEVYAYVHGNNPIVINTTPASEITHESAICGGKVISQGGSAIKARGICWSTTNDPSLDDNYTLDGDEVGAYSSHLENLSTGTIYFYKAYAINARDTAYGSLLSFNTNSLPSVETLPVIAIRFRSARSGGKLIDTGGSLITKKGVCWSTNSIPDTTDSYIINGNGSSNFQSSIYGLVRNTTYYLRAYVVSDVGVAYGQTIEFSTLIGGDPCPGTPSVTDFDGNQYSTVQIGYQCWMQENLGTTHYSDGIPILDGTGLTNIGATDTIKCYFNYNDDPTISSEYGLLYTWTAVMNGAIGSNSNPSGIQGVCPSGWHVPSAGEWTQLRSYLGVDGSVLAGMLKEQGTIHWVSTSSMVSNETGFTALPNGKRQNNSFFDLQHTAYFHSARPESSGWVSQAVIDKDNNINLTGATQFSDGMGVRCIKD